MGELWWAEAVLPKDREPDWLAAESLIDALTYQDICELCPEYLDNIGDSALDSPQIPVTDASGDSSRRQMLVWLVQLLARVDLVNLIAIFDQGQPEICAFESAGLRIFVHESGYSSGGPDQLCDRWLRLRNIGVFERAGFLPTVALDRGWGTRSTQE